MPTTEVVLLIAMIVVSVGAAASLLQATMSTVVNGDLARGEAERSLIKKMKQHVIVFGYAHLGRSPSEIVHCKHSALIEGE